jgi:hypothetical protein
MHPHAHQLLTKSFMMQALVECEGESIDLSGDMGAVGRVVIPDTPSGNSEMYLDLKGIFCFVMIIYWLPRSSFGIISNTPHLI